MIGFGKFLGSLVYLLGNRADTASMTGSAHAKLNHIVNKVVDPFAPVTIYTNYYQADPNGTATVATITGKYYVLGGSITMVPGNAVIKIYIDSVLKQTIDFTWNDGYVSNVIKSGVINRYTAMYDYPNSEWELGVSADVWVYNIPAFGFNTNFYVTVTTSNTTYVATNIWYVEA